MLLSGGLDSVTTLALAVAEGHACHALSFSYGQRHAVELDCARVQAERLGAVDHRVVELAELAELVRSATSLVEGSALAVPKDACDDTAIPTTYVPARNTIFLAYALAWAEAIGAKKIFIGVNALDYSGYPDCRPQFIAAFETMANLATRDGGFTIQTPLQDLRKHEIIALGIRHGVEYADTVSCYDPAAGPLACGHCDSCRLRRAGFEQAGIPDPTRYR